MRYREPLRASLSLGSVGDLDAFIEIKPMQIHYSQTPALQSLPQSQRCKAYRTAHKAMMASDASYRHHWHVYSWALIGIIIIGAVSHEIFPALSSFWEMPITLVALITTMFWQQNYMNTQVDDYMTKNQNGNAGA